MSRQEALELAKKRILPLGYKPEDYLVNDPGHPLRIARLVVKEMSHILYMAQKWESILNVPYI